MAGSCYVSLGLWPGIQVGGERPTLVGAQCLGESGLEKISKRVRGSGCMISGAAELACISHILHSPQEMHTRDLLLACPVL